MSPRKVVVIGGAGHIGLPLGLVLADIGHKVSCFDINLEAVQQINSGEMPF
jgi:UDP-N-acetyl-D-mannosaminuronic acid dehydrogenase